MGRLNPRVLWRHGPATPFAGSHLWCICRHRWCAPARICRIRAAWNRRMQAVRVVPQTGWLREWLGVPALSLMSRGCQQRAPENQVRPVEEAAFLGEGIEHRAVTLGSAAAPGSHDIRFHAGAGNVESSHRRTPIRPQARGEVPDVCSAPHQSARLAARQPIARQPTIRWPAARGLLARGPAARGLAVERICFARDGQVQTLRVALESRGLPKLPGL
mmetsp:Transcript_55885/g.141516  ORF Transcript_55885/g.141516 Transcript_55885/m.141516 type:complete len:217 (-) Transcript_55885:268-918(-)